MTSSPLGNEQLKLPDLSSKDTGTLRDSPSFQMADSNSERSNGGSPAVQEASEQAKDTTITSFDEVEGNLSIQIRGPPVQDVPVPNDKIHSYDVRPEDEDLEEKQEPTSEDEFLIHKSDEAAEEVKLPDESKNTSSIGGASFNFINSIIGSGIIGIPSAIQKSGFLFGVILLMIVAGITDYTVILLIKNGLMSKKFSYQEMVTAAWGRPGYWYLTLVQFLFPFFAMSGYIVIVGDTLSRILSQIFFLAYHDSDHVPEVLAEPRNMLIKLAMVVIIMLPLSMLRKISKLEKFSAFAVLCIVFIVSVTIYEAAHLYCTVRCFQPLVDDESTFTTWFINTSFVQGIGIIAFAFVCHHNTYLIYASLRNRSLKRFSIVSHISVSTSFIFCAVLGISGFVALMDQTQGDLLNNYCDYDPVANTARFFYACVIMLTYPIECFVAREVLEISLSLFPSWIVDKIPIHWLRSGVEKFLYTPRHESLVRHIVLTLILVFTTLVIGGSTNDLGVVLAFTGCFTAVPLVFILPTISFLKLSKNKWYSPSKLLALLVFLIGMAVMIIGTVLAVIEAVDSYRQKPAQFKPIYCPAPEAYHNNTCCQLYNATNNFTTFIRFCDCPQLCPNSSLLPYLSEEYCNYSTSDFY